MHTSTLIILGVYLVLWLAFLKAPVGFTWFLNLIVQGSIVLLIFGGIAIAQNFGAYPFSFISREFAEVFPVMLNATVFFWIVRGWMENEKYRGRHNDMRGPQWRRFVFLNGGTLACLLLMNVLNAFDTRTVNTDYFGGSGSILACMFTVFFPFAASIYNLVWMDTMNTIRIWEHRQSEVLPRKLERANMNQSILQDLDAYKLTDRQILDSRITPELPAPARPQPHTGWK